MLIDNKQLFSGGKKKVRVGEGADIGKTGKFECFLLMRPTGC